MCEYSFLFGEKIVGISLLRHLCSHFEQPLSLLIIDEFNSLAILILGMPLYSMNDRAYQADLDG